MFSPETARLGPAILSPLRYLRHHLVSIFLLIIVAVSAQSNLIDPFQPPPTFTSPREINVNENDPIGIRVFKVTVEGGPVKFRIDQSVYRDGSQYFKVDEDTGEIYLTKRLEGLDDDVYFYMVAVTKQETSARIEFRVRIKKGAKDRSKSVPLPPFGNFTNALPNPLPEYSRPNEKPRETVFTSIARKRPSTTVKPPEKPPSDPWNNPRRNGSTKNGAKRPSLQTEQVFDEESAIEGADSSRMQISSQLVYILGAIFVPALCLCIWIACKCHRSVPTRIKTFKHKIVNNNKSDSSETTISSLSSELDNRDVFFGSKKSFACKELSAHSNRSLLKVGENEWEFPRHHLKFVHILGEGCFGQVWKCEAVNISSNGGSQVVAVKTLKQNANQKEKQDLLEELEVMKMLEPHPNVVTLIGCCAEQDPVLLIMEYIPNGTLQSYLRESRVENNYSTCRLTSNDLINFAYQVARGMEFLSSKGIIHRDLAARNILIGFNKVCKIADFGFAKYDEVYERKSEGRLPIRWMAVESLTDFIFTSKSDVWSYGILLWELVTLGWTPYPGFSAAEVIKKVSEGYRLEKPEHCKREIFNIMYYCWDKDPAKRPSFSELVSLLDNILCSQNDYIELDRFPDHGYYNILKPGNTGEKL